MVRSCGIKATRYCTSREVAPFPSDFERIVAVGAGRACQAGERAGGRASAAAARAKRGAASESAEFAVQGCDRVGPSTLPGRGREFLRRPGERGPRR